jgi:hypothetical protein
MEKRDIFIPVNGTHEKKMDALLQGKLLRNFEAINCVVRHLSGENQHLYLFLFRF